MARHTRCDSLPDPVAHRKGNGTTRESVAPRDIDAVSDSTPTDPRIVRWSADSPSPWVQWPAGHVRSSTAILGSVLERCDYSDGRWDDLLGIIVGNSAVCCHLCERTLVPLAAHRRSNQLASPVRTALHSDVIEEVITTTMTNLPTARHHAGEAHIAASTNYFQSSASQRCRVRADVCLGNGCSPLEVFAAQCFCFRVTGSMAEASINLSSRSGLLVVRVRADGVPSGVHGAGRSPASRRGGGTTRSRSSCRFRSISSWPHRSSCCENGWGGVSARLK
jgi:hypothetical protein